MRTPTSPPEGESPNSRCQGSEAFLRSEAAKASRPPIRTTLGETAAR